MCRFVVQIKKATLNGLDKLFHLTFVVRAPVSEVAWDCSSQFIESLFLSWSGILFSLVTPSLLNWTKKQKKVSDKASVKKQAWSWKGRKCGMVGKVYILIVKIIGFCAFKCLRHGKLGEIIHSPLSQWMILSLPGTFLYNHFHSLLITTDLVNKWPHSSQMLMCSGLGQHT